MAARILGISAFTEKAAAALVEGSRVVGATREEQWSRIRGDAGLPLRAVHQLLGESTAAELDQVVFFEKPLRRFERTLANAVATFPWSLPSFPREMNRWLGDRLWTRNRLVAGLRVPPEKVLFCEHHRAHAAAAFFPSPFEEAWVLVAEGEGEWATTSLWKGRGKTITAHSEIRSPHSLGLLRRELSRHLGFVGADAWTYLRAAAKRGQASPLESNVGLALSGLLVWDDQGGFRIAEGCLAWNRRDRLEARLRVPTELGPPRAPGDTDGASQEICDLAASVHHFFVEALVRLVQGVRARGGPPNLCLGGELWEDPELLHRLAQELGATNIFIPPAPGDDGAALGAAMWWAIVGLGEERPEEPMMALGPTISRAHIQELAQDLELPNESFPGEPQMLARAAAELRAGRRIGWWSGPPEWPGRALGARCSLMAVGAGELAKHLDCSPARIGMIDPKAKPAYQGASPVRGDPEAELLVHWPLLGRLLAEVGPVHHGPLALREEPSPGSLTDALSTLVRGGVEVLYLEGLRIGPPPPGRYLPESTPTAGS